MDFAWVVPLVSAGVGAFFGGYLKTKGENFATHEDIDKLKDQVAAVTTTTEQIKTEISDAAWNRQKRWELKREVLFEAVNKLTEMEVALKELDRAVQIPERANAGWQKVVAEKYETWRNRSADFDKAIDLVLIVSGIKVYSAFVEFGGLVENTAHMIGAFNSELLYKETLDALIPRRLDVIAEVQTELGIEDASIRGPADGQSA